MLGRASGSALARLQLNHDAERFCPELVGRRGDVSGPQRRPVGGVLANVFMDGGQSILDMDVVFPATIKKKSSPIGRLAANF